MAEWSSAFDDIMEQMDIAHLNDGNRELSLFHAFIKAWQFEDDCLVWITSVPGANLFGSTVVFVNKEVLNKLQWSFAEWADGTAPAAVFRVEEAENINLHLMKKTQAPILALVRKKTTPQNQEGNNYYLIFHHDLPYNLRMTVGIPYEGTT